MIAQGKVDHHPRRGEVKNYRPRGEGGRMAGQRIKEGNHMIRGGTPAIGGKGAACEGKGGGRHLRLQGPLTPPAAKGAITPSAPNIPPPLHPSHRRHTLKEKKIDGLYTCDGCKEYGFGTCYTCTSAACNVHLHKVCANPEQIISHPFFPECRFRFLKNGSPNRYCDACGKDINGYVYHCYEEGFDLHPCCAKLPHVKKFDKDGRDELKLVLKKKVSSECSKCRKKKLLKEVNTWSYVSKNKEIHFHVGCVMDLMRKCLRDGLQIEKVDSWPKLRKLKKVLRFVLTLVISILIGDPTGIVVGVFAALIPQ